MSRNTSRIDVQYTSDSVNETLPPRLPDPDAGASGTGETGVIRTLWYNQGEDQFLRLDDSIEVPSFPVHHDIRSHRPPVLYEENLAKVLRQCVRAIPSLFAGTTWYFDPVSILTPSFFRIDEWNGARYLYVCRLDLAARPLEMSILAQGSNDRTHQYLSRRLYFECDWFPLAGGPEGAFDIEASIPATWKGEAGQGYMIHGIWMDSDINKFFSKLILPPGIRNHPYYPLTCKRHCVSMNAAGRRNPGALHAARSFIEPALEDILSYLNTYSFSELAPLFVGLKKDVPEELSQEWKNLSVRPYLNEQDNKEYQIVF